ncbi:uncharacterized protein LOC108488466 isoform X1 [Gossypium arboreum]|uniref:uncharacterized protein LOC108488466 isoform X1 n=1 Tax=Gossypium arboreum TaxID=29729 RepID=UPI0022F16672|nr:uncharacterized protein LOC108488466 isoform X1 [Gossypium arboreum]
MYESLHFAYGLLEVLISVTSITIWNKGIISQIILSFPIAVFTGRNMFAERSKQEHTYPGWEGDGISALYLSQLCQSTSSGGMLEFTVRDSETFC